MNKLQFLRTVCAFTLLLGMTSALSASNDTPIKLQMLEHEALDDNDSAQLLYGLAYLEGRDGLKPDAEKAVYWFRRAARGKNTYAQLMLGKCNANGQGVKENAEQAVQWWRKAALKGNAQAQYFIGKAHLDGVGTSKDSTRAIYWITKSAEQENKDAQYLLGKMYHEGYHVKQDNEIARSWLSRVAQQGHNDAINLLATINSAMLDVTTKVYQQSADVLIGKARQGDTQAEFELGLRYESGAWDVNKDNAQALIWITKAAEDGNRIAMKTLADIYRHGDLDLSPDPDKAAAWDKKASIAR